MQEILNINDKKKDMKRKINKENRQGLSSNTQQETTNEINNKEDSLNNEDADKKNNNFDKESFYAATQKFKLLSLIEVHLND
jgi:hypothetical protein